MEQLLQDTPHNTNSLEVRR